MNADKKTDESAFEEAIVESLIDTGGYVRGYPANFNKDMALDTHNLLAFIRSTQPEAWEKYQSIRGENAEEKFLARVCTELNNRGTLDVLRHGITDYSIRFKMAYFKPASGLNPDTLSLYDKNIPAVYRQVYYSKANNNSIDIMLTLNGLPVATAEVKNPYTGQNVLDAQKQYMQDRDPRELLFRFKIRALVHFALDPDLVFMTTRLAGKDTLFLPFNKGHNRGAGNPPNPNGHRTAYLWEETWTKDNWLEIIANYLHLEKEEPDKSKTKGRKKKEKLIFPRYHQLDAVRRLVADARESGPGKDYLVQHSAGSGKSNTIAWLAYRLASLHNRQDKRVFDSVIVITDRRVLDDQLQDTIYQFEHTSGVVVPIDKDSNQLALALTSGANIIITTLQKFPFVVEKVQNLPQRNYALIVDEAHSSQGGETSESMKAALTVIDMPPEKPGRIALDRTGYGDDFNDVSDTQDKIRETMLTRGRQPNLSFFAFTATPKAKTLEVFGVKTSDGTHVPFHLYSMRQAIEEHFIMDVLENYITYETFFRINKAIEEDPEVNKKKAVRAIARFISLHPHNLAQKTEVMVEHFRQATMKKINGRAKAMVVTQSRPHVIRYKREFDRYIENKGYPIKTLVAFAPFTDGETGEQYREYDINQIREKELPEKFATDEYQILLVADKYQTGFDQPLLHTMYVDKKLSGVKAVQTLSRLNRVYPGKEDTFVLDFANSSEEIQEAFQTYYEKTSLMESTDPNRLYDLKGELDGYRVIWPAEVERFCKVFFKGKQRLTARDHAALEAAIQPAVERFRGLADEEEQESFKHSLAVFVRLYAFLAQIMPFSDMELEKFYAYGRYLLTRLPRRRDPHRFRLDDEVTLEYYRLQRINGEGLHLEQGTEGELHPLSEAGTVVDREETAALSEIIEQMNERFGTDFTENDLYFIQAVVEDMVGEESLYNQANSNTIDNFKFGFEEKFIDMVIKRRELNDKMFVRLMDDNAIREFVIKYMLPIVYKRLRGKPGKGPSS